MPAGLILPPVARRLAWPALICGWQAVLPAPMPVESAGSGTPPGRGNPFCAEQGAALLHAISHE
jgi:hypothetical protein